MIRISLAFLIYASLASAQNWQCSVIPLTPQPYQANWSQVHVLPVSEGNTIIASGRWDYPPVAMYDSLGQQAWCLCGDPISNEIRRSYALDVVRIPGGFAALFYYRFFVGGPSYAFGRLFGSGSVYQTLLLSDTTSAFRAAHDGTKSYFLCRYTNASNRFFIAAASDSGVVWEYPLNGEGWEDTPYDFSISKDFGVAYCANHHENEISNIAIKTLNMGGVVIDYQLLHNDSIGVPVKMTSDNVSGCWIIGVDNPDLPSDELHLYHSASQTHHAVPLEMTIPPIETGAVPSLHAIPFGESILIAGQAALDSGEDCLFTLTFSTSGESRVDTILGITQMLDIAGDGNNGYTAAVRVAAGDDIQLLRAPSTVSNTDDNFILQPLSFNLSAYPNPFNAQTTIQFDLPQAGDVSLKLFDLLGREVATLLDEQRRSGSHTIAYSAAHLASGVYFVSLKSGDVSATHKLLLLR